MDLLLDPEEQIRCPYNSAHYIMRKRMNTHLSKCKRNYPDAKLVECDFNVNHKIPEPELQYHHENCPDRRKIEHTVYQEEGVILNKFPIYNIEVETDESWDCLNAPAYDPVKYCEKNKIIRHLDVASAAKRKNFRMEERHRLSQLSKAEPSASTSVQPPAQNRNTVMRRNLPDKPTSSTQEETPELVTDILERLKIGKNKAYVPKQNFEQ